ncbi:MAG: BrnA antitoxin family protein [Xanthomonadales bacterium]|nr:BrnA antitoxin family protein [Xanthomonadales bacterium]
MNTSRELVPVTLRMPVDVVESLKAIAPRKGMSGYQALLKLYVSEGLRHDEATYLFDRASRLTDALRKRGVSAQIIEAAVRDVA